MERDETVLTFPFRGVILHLDIYLNMTMRIQNIKDGDDGDGASDDV